LIGSPFSATALASDVGLGCNKNAAASKLSKFLQFMAILVVAAVAGAAGGMGGKYLRMYAGAPSKADVDGVMSNIRSTPLLGLVLSEHPHLEA
jgi:hypothetical protein